MTAPRLGPRLAAYLATVRDEALAEAEEVLAREEELHHGLRVQVEVNLQNAERAQRRLDLFGEA